MVRVYKESTRSRQRNGKHFRKKNSWEETSFPYRLFNWYTGLSIWQTAFGILLGNVALIALAPAFFSELITLGVFFQVLNAFGRVESSMTFFVDSWSVIVDFMSVVKRLRQFNRALDEGDKEK